MMQKLIYEAQLSQNRLLTGMLNTNIKHLERSFKASTRFNMHVFSVIPLSLSEQQAFTPFNGNHHTCL
jgi:hypothetical protein